MAASANPSGNKESNNNTSNGHNPPPNGLKNNNRGSSDGNPNKINRNSKNSFRSPALKHHPDPGLALNWTDEEQLILEQGLMKYASEPIISRYTSIALELPEKTARDVSLRHRWMNKKENSKRRKDDLNLTRKNKDRKEVLDPSTKSSSHYALPMIPMDNEDDISFEAIGGAAGQLLKQNDQAFNQISTNFAYCQYMENINLLRQIRDNILTISKDLNDNAQGLMKQMPPLPALNEELANSILTPSLPTMHQ